MFLIDGPGQSVTLYQYNGCFVPSWICVTPQFSAACKVLSAFSLRWLGTSVPLYTLHLLFDFPLNSSTLMNFVARLNL
jgi:hypothetical protein